MKMFRQNNLNKIKVLQRTKSRQIKGNRHDIIPNRKKTKNDLVSRKEEKFSCDECIFKTNIKQSLKKHNKSSCEAKFFATISKLSPGRGDYSLPVFLVLPLAAETHQSRDLHPADC